MCFLLIKVNLWGVHLTFASWLRPTNKSSNKSIFATLIGKKMKQWMFVIAVAGMLSASFLSAQPGQGTRPAPGVMRAELEELQLTDAQKARMKEIRDKYQGKFQAIREDQTQHREAMRKEMDAMRAELRNVLDPAQQAKFDAMPKPMRPNGPTPPPAMGRGPRGNQGHQGMRPSQGGPKRMGPPPSMELRNAVDAYSKNQIMPVLTRERKALEAKISPADRELLASLRTQAKAQPSRMGPGAGRPASRHAGRKGAPGPKHEALLKLEKRYEKELQKIFARLEPQVDKWNADLEAIHIKYATENPAGKPGGPRGSQAYRWLHPKRFLMLSPE